MHWFLHLNTCQDYEKHFPLQLSFYVCCQYLLKSELNYIVSQHFSGDSVILRIGHGINNSSKVWSSLEIIIMKRTIWSLLTEVKKPISKFQSWPLNYTSLERIIVHRRVCVDVTTVLSELIRKDDERQEMATFRMAFKGLLALWRRVIKTRSLKLEWKSESEESCSHDKKSQRHCFARGSERCNLEGCVSVWHWPFITQTHSHSMVW